jgi:cell division protein FtsB
MIRFFLRTAVPALCVMMILYFAYAATLGPYGLREAASAARVRDALASEVAEIEARRERLRLIADQLNPKGIDPDLLDEKIRSVLGYVAEGDVVVPREELEKVLKEIRSRAEPAR